MKQVPIKLGPLAVLLTVISICLTVLSILAFTTAGADERLAQKYAQTVKVRYELEAEGQAFVRDSVQGGVAGAGVQMQEFEQNGSLLRIEYQADGEGFNIISWQHQREWSEDTEINIWDGE